MTSCSPWRLPLGWLAVSIGALTGCPDAAPIPPDRNYSVILSVADLTTNHPPTVPLEILITDLEVTVDEFMGGELPSWMEAARVVSWPQRTVVAGYWSFTSPEGGGLLRFVPTQPLEEGWYAMQVNFSMISVPRGIFGDMVPDVAQRGVGAHTWDDGWTTSRFHVGSFPLVWVSGGIDAPGDGLLGGGSLRLHTTESLVLEEEIHPADLLTVLVANRPVSCIVRTPASLGAGDLFEGFLYECESIPSDGELAVSLAVPRWHASSGATVRFCAPGAVPRWTSLGDLSRANCEGSVFAGAGGAP